MRLRAAPSPNEVLDATWRALASKDPFRRFRYRTLRPEVEAANRQASVSVVCDLTRVLEYLRKAAAPNDFAGTLG